MSLTLALSRSFTAACMLYFLLLVPNSVAIDWTIQDAFKPTATSLHLPGDMLSSMVVSASKLCTGALRGLATGVVTSTGFATYGSTTLPMGILASAVSSAFASTSWVSPPSEASNLR